MKLGGTGGTEGYTRIVAGRGGGGEWRYTGTRRAGASSEKGIIHSVCKVDLCNPNEM